MSEHDVTDNLKVKMMTPLPFALALPVKASVFAAACAFASFASWAVMTEPYVSYTVKPSDTLQGLSRSLLTDPSKWGEVAKLNELKNPNLIFPGQVIDVPKSLLNLSSQPRLAVPGTVLSVQGDVTIGGQQVQVGAPVPEGARLQTGPNSSAIVQLGDGSRLQLMPKTLADVVTQHGYAMRNPASSASTTWFSGAIRLVEGVLDTLAEKKASRLTPLTVTTPTSVVGVRGTNFRVAYEDPASGLARTEVLEGKVRSDNTAQKVGADVGGGFGAAFRPQDREIKIVALLPALADSLLPAEVLRASASSATPQRAEWAVGTLAGAAGYRAQFSIDAEFAQIQSDIKSETPALDVTALANGSYYARVRGIDPSGIEGFDAIKLVQIKNAPVVVSLVWPKEVSIGATADFVPNGVLLKFYGKSPDLPAQLIVEVASDIAITQAVQRASFNADGSLLVRNVPAGKRSYVRFSSVATASQPAASAVFTLDVPGNWGSTILGMTQALQPVR
jgi:hypothetical protein